MSRTLVARLRWTAFWLGIALLFAARAAARDGGGLAAWLDALAWYLPVFLLWGLFALVAAALGRRFPLDGGRRAHLYLHAAAAVGLSLVHPAALAVLAALAARLAPAVALPADAGATVALLFHQNYLAYWLVVFGSRALELARRARDQQIAAARLRQQLAEARLAALRMQLHPHFLFNTLNSIAELLHVDRAAARQMVQRLASLLRTAIDTAADHVVALGDEVDFLRRYLEVETMRFQDRLEVRFEIPPEARGLRVPALVLQPLVENALRHGVGRLRRGGEIVVRAIVVDGALLLEVENDVDGAPQPAAGAARRGVGLDNTSARLAQLYGEDAALSTGPSADGRHFLARLELPLVGAEPPAPGPERPAAIQLAGSAA